MTTQEHLKRVIDDLTAKKKLAELKSRDARTEADTYEKAIEVIEVELTRIPKASYVPANPLRREDAK